MMDKGMVSIIVPIYNVEKYLCSCIDSLLAQTYRNIQIILVNDGSTDHCGAICDNYAAIDSRVLALHKSNGGVSSARNYGLDYVAGTYLTFCDGDDAYHLEWIQQLVDAIEENQADAALGCFVKVFADGSMISEDLHETGVWQTNTDKSKIEYCFNMLMTPRHGWEITVRLFRSDIILNNHIRFCDNCGNYAEDLGFTLAFSLFASRVVSTEYCGYLYNIRHNSMMQTSVRAPKLESLHRVYLSVEPLIRQVFAPDVADRVLPWFYLQMVGQQFASKLWSSGMTPEETRYAAIAGVDDWLDMKQRLYWCSRIRIGWNPYYSTRYNIELISHIRFLLGGSWQHLRMCCKLLRIFQSVTNLLEKP